MHKTAFADLHLSRLMLGTVQFGLPYGIANISGQPSYEAAREIIACAYENGVNCLDTAPRYGVSEEVVGRALEDLGLADKFVVVSKVLPMAEDFSTQQAADAFVEESIVASLRRLRLPQLPICLFHLQQNFRYIDSLDRARSRGLIGHLGVSFATPQDCAEIVASGHVEAVQIPTNILDRRYRRQGVFELAQQHRVAIFLRSAYHQGLLVMREEDMLPELAEVLPVLRELHRLAREAGLGRDELALRYVLGIEGLTCVVVGMETVDQVRQNVRLFAQGPLPAELQRAVDSVVPELSEKILHPFNWSNRMSAPPPERR
jgi:aryl-alcohol dehydrogenase-like predicted oxidoreductase